MAQAESSPTTFLHPMRSSPHGTQRFTTCINAPIDSPECVSFSQRRSLSPKRESAKARESNFRWCLSAIISLALLMVISSQLFWGKSSCLSPSCLPPLFMEDYTRKAEAVDKASSTCHQGIEIGIFALAEQVRDVARTGAGGHVPEDWGYTDLTKSGLGHFERQEARSVVFSSSLDNISITPVPGFAYRTPFVLKSTKNVVVGTNVSNPARLGATTFTKALFARIRSESIAKSNGTKPLSYLSDEAAAGGQLMPVTVCLVRTSFLGIAFTSRVCVDESKFMTIATTTAAPTTTATTFANETVAESTSTSTTTTLPPLPLPFHNTHVCDAVNAVALSKTCAINPLVVYCVCPVSQLQKNSPNFVTSQPLDVTYTRDVVAADRNYLPWRSNLAKNYPSASSAFMRGAEGVGADSDGAGGGLAMAQMREEEGVGVVDAETVADTTTITDELSGGGTVRDDGSGDLSLDLKEDSSSGKAMIGMNAGGSNTTTTTTTGPTFLPPPLFADLCPGCDYYYRTRSKTMSLSITKSGEGDWQTASSSKSLTDSSFLLAKEESTTMSPTGAQSQTTPSESSSLARSYSQSQSKTDFHPKDPSTSVALTTSSANSSSAAETAFSSNGSTSVWGSNASESNGDAFTTAFAVNESHTNVTIVSTEISRENATFGDTSSGIPSETNSTSTVAPSNDTAPMAMAAALLFPPPPPLRLGGEFRGAQANGDGATFFVSEHTTAGDGDHGRDEYVRRGQEDDEQTRRSTNSRQMAPAAVDLTGFVQLQFQFQLEHADPLLLGAQSIDDVQEELDYLNSIVQYVIKDTPDFATSFQLRKDKFRLQDVYSGLPSQPVAPTRAPTTTTTPNTNTHPTPTSATDMTTTTSSPPTTTTTGTTTTSTPLTSPSTAAPTSTATTTVTTTSTTARPTTTPTTSSAPTSAPTTTLIVTDVTNVTHDPNTTVPETEEERRQRHRALTVVKNTLLFCLVLLIIPAVVIPYICYKSWKKGKWEAYKLRNFRLSDDPAEADAVTMDDVELAVNGDGAGRATDRMGLSTFGIATSAIPAHGAAGDDGAGGGGGPSVPVPLVDVNKDGSKGVRYGGDNDLLAMRVGMGQGKWARSPSLAGGGGGADNVGRKGRNTLSQQQHHLYGNLAAAEFDPVRDHAAKVKASERRAAKRLAKRDAVKRAVAEENTQVMGDEMDAAEGGLANTADEGEDGATQRGTKRKGGSGTASGASASAGEVALDFDDDDEEDDEENDGENEDGYDSDKAGLNSTRGTLAPALSISSPFSSTNVRKKLLLLDSEEQSHLRRRTAANVLQLVTAGLGDDANDAGKKKTASATQAKGASSASNASLLTGDKKKSNTTAAAAAATSKSGALARHHREDDTDEGDNEEYSDAGDAEGHDENEHDVEEEEYEEVEEEEEEEEAESVDHDDENMR